MEVSVEIMGVPFVVSRTPYCLWGIDLQSRVSSFLAALKPEYFEYQVELLAREAETSDRQFRAFAIRLLYFHALETFFALVGSMLQAPTAAPGWMAKYKLGELRDVVRSIGRGDLTLSRFPSATSWRSVSDIVNGPFAKQDPPRPDMVEGFARAWSRAAHEFLDENLQAEYNSLKHGFRVELGGFRMRIGEEAVYGQRVPPEQMIDMGGSEFGTSFFKIESMDAPSVNFQLRNYMRNWSPESLVGRIELLSWSMHNVISFLRVTNGANPNDVTLQHPSEAHLFDQMWGDDPSMLASSMDQSIEPASVPLMSRQEVLDSYRLDNS